MNKGSINEHEQRLRALNADGILFQERVRNLLLKAGFTFHASEFGVDTSPKNLITYRESRLDLWFRLTHGGCVFDLLVECKKADPRLKEWIFFQTTDDKPMYRAELVRRGQDSKWEHARFNVGHDLNYVFVGKELKGEWHSKGTDSWKSSSERIDKACDQISIATKSITSRLRDNKDPHPVSGGAPHFVIPIVVTSADLLAATFAPEFYSSKSVEVASNEMTFKSTSSVVIRHALASNLQADLLVYQGEQSRDFVQMVGYQDILICSLDSLGVETQRLCHAVAKEYKTHL